MSSENKTSEEKETPESEPQEAPDEVKQEDSTEESAEVVELQEEPSEAFEIGAEDPLVVILTWAFTFAAGKGFVRVNMEKFRKFLPAVAICSAVGIKAGFNALEGSAMTVEDFGAALGIAGLAVLGHSQLRELSKAFEEAKKES